MKIYLVRHGQTDWNYQKKIQGQQDVDINERASGRQKNWRRY